MGYLPRTWGMILMAGLALAGCSREEAATSSPEASAPQAIPAAVPSLPALPEAALDRRALVEAAATAAAAFAAGEPVSSEQLAGRRFSVKVAFGCGGRTDERKAVRYRMGEGGQTLHISARPEDFSQTAFARPGEAAEAIEGFWLTRPWMLTEGCPAVNAPGEPADAPLPAAPETVALAQVYEAGGSRLARRGARPYEVTRRLEAGQAPGADGLRLVLEGRITTQRPPVRCQARYPDLRPVCLIEGEFDRVAFETPDGRLLSEWRP